MKSRILILEDNSLLRRALRRRLGLAGFQTVEAESCRQATRVSGSFAAAVVDIQLLDGCGCDVAETLLARGVVARVVFFTGGAPPAELTRAATLGVVLFKGGGFDEVLDELMR